ncbi:hypothetical protein D3C87_1817290 [compost metagenome]
MTNAASEDLSAKFLPDSVQPTPTTKVVPVPGVTPNVKPQIVPTPVATPAASPAPTPTPTPAKPAQENP